MSETPHSETEVLCKFWFLQFCRNIIGSSKNSRRNSIVDDNMSEATCCILFSWSINGTKSWFLLLSICLRRDFFCYLCVLPPNFNFPDVLIDIFEFCPVGHYEERQRIHLNWILVYFFLLFGSIIVHFIQKSCYFLKKSHTVTPQQNLQ